MQKQVEATMIAVQTHKIKIFMKILTLSRPFASAEVGRRDFCRDGYPIFKSD